MSSFLDSQPKLRAETFTSFGSGLKITGRLSKLGELKTGLSFVLVYEQGTLEGQFSELNPDNLECVFDTVSKPVSDLEISNCYLVLNGYWGERAALVLTPDNRWAKTPFIPSKANAVHIPGSGTVMTDAGKPLSAQKDERVWDHEHCAICWATISEHPNTQSYGYRNQDDIWVCQNCYQKYVVKRSVEFWD